MTYRDATALVTGASTALGLEFCRQLATRYQRVIAVANNEHELAGLASRVSATPEIHPLSADLATVVGLTRVTEAIRQRGPVEVLVNLANGAANGEFSRARIEGELALTRLHVEAPLTLCRAVIPYMQERGRGAIINLSDVCGFTPQPGSAVLGAAGAFLTNFSLALRDELTGSGIRVQLLCLGPMVAEQQKIPPATETTAGQLTESSDLSLMAAVRASLDALDTDQALVIPYREDRRTASDGVERLRQALVGG
jgi:short-subunit dehydrogenase